MVFLEQLIIARELKEVVHPILDEITKLPAWNLMANRLREVQLNLLTRDPPTGTIGLATNIMKIDGQEVYVPLTKVFDASGYNARVHIENLYVNRPGFPYGYDDFNLRFLDPFTLQGNQKALRDINPTTLDEIFGLADIDLTQQLEMFHIVLLAVMGLSSTKHSGTTVYLADGMLRTIRKSGSDNKIGMTFMRNVPVDQNGFWDLELMLTRVAANRDYSFTTYGNSLTVGSVFQVHKINVENLVTVNIRIKDLGEFTYTYQGEYIALTKPAYRNLITKIEQAAGMTQLNRLLDVEFNRIFWKYLNNDIEDTSIFRRIDGTHDPDIGHFPSTFKLKIGKWLEPLEGYIDETSKKAVFDALVEHYGDARSINSRSLMIHYFDMIMEHPEKEISLVLKKERTPEFAYLFGSDVDPTKPFRLSDIRLRTKEVKSHEAPHEFFKEYIVTQYGAIRHYFEMIRRELQYDLDDYVHNIIAFIENLTPYYENLVRKDPVGIFQIASALAHPNTYRAPNGKIVSVHESGSRKWTPIFVNVGNADRATIRNRLKNIDLFNQLEKQQQGMVVQFVESLNFDFYTIIDQYVPKMQKNHN